MPAETIGDHGGALPADGTRSGPVTSSARRWAMCPVDFCVHLLVSEGGHVSGGLMARCGHLLPTTVNQHDQPPPGPTCERCNLIFLADFTRDSTHPQGVNVGGLDTRSCPQVAGLAD